jgi:hypothetical protein
LTGFQAVIRSRDGRLLRLRTVEVLRSREIAERFAAPTERGGLGRAQAAEKLQALAKGRVPER